MPRQRLTNNLEDEEYEDGAHVIESSGEESGEENSEKGGEESGEGSSEEMDEARERMAEEFGQFNERSAEAPAAARAVVPISSDPIDRLEYREDDPAFNAVLQRMRRVEEAVGMTSHTALAANGGGLRIEARLAEYKVVIRDHSRCPTTGRKFVPGGAANATECVRTRLGHFPHYIEKVEEEEGGGILYHVVTSNNILIVASVQRVDNVDSPVKISEKVVLERANAVFRHELEAKGEYPLTELRMRMRLVAAHIAHTDPGADPIGVDEDRWWDRDLCTELDGQREKSQLLIPAEFNGTYTQAILNGKVSYSFKIRSGVTSFSCRAHRRCLFRFCVEPESEVLRTNCPNLTALSEPFWSSAKFAAGRPPKPEAWVESSVEGGPPVKYSLKRRRPIDEPEAAEGEA
jgi:hypothetical protein